VSRKLALIPVVWLVAGALQLQAFVPPIPRAAPGVLPEADETAKKPEEPTAPTEEDTPEKILDRITNSAKSIGDKLKDQDTSSDTLKQQEQLLKDIDSLLKPPPPQSGGGGGGGGSSGGGSQKPMPNGGSSGQGQQKPMSDGAGGPGAGQKPMPSGTGGSKPEPQSGEAGGKEQSGQGSTGQGGKSGAPLLPNEDPFTKQVWGHLPEKLRQQALQSYKEQFMPRYNGLLKQYYNSLADQEKQRKK